MYRLAGDLASLLGRHPTVHRGLIRMDGRKAMTMGERDHWSASLGAIMLYAATGATLSTTSASRWTKVQLGEASSGITSGPMRNRLLGGVLLLGISSLANAPGCSHETSPVRDARAEAVASAAERLQGRWVLVSFQPELALEPTLQMLLNMQIGRLVAEFRGSQVSAQGPGVQVERTFRVQEAYGDHFKATVYDAYGVGVDSSNDFSGDLLVVNGITSPWRGRAVFRRAP